MANRSIDKSEFRNPYRVRGLNVSDEESIDPETWQNLRTLDDNFTGMIALLYAMSPSLEELYWHWYETRVWGVAYNDLQYEIVFQRIIHAVVLKQLKTCTLSGLYANEDDLLTLLEKSRNLRRLSLIDVNIGNGIWRHVFDVCSSEESHVEYLFCDDLRESNMIWFEGPGVAKMPRIQPWGPSTLCRDGREEVKKRIVYHIAVGRLMGSPQVYAWRRKRRLEYGPP